MKINIKDCIFCMFKVHNHACHIALKSTRRIQYRLSSEQMSELRHTNFKRIIKLQVLK